MAEMPTPEVENRALFLYVHFKTSCTLHRKTNNFPIRRISVEDTEHVPTYQTQLRS